MKTSFAILVFVLFASSLAEAAISFAGLPPARSLAASIQNLQARRDRVIDTMLARPLAKPPIPDKIGLDDFANSMLARMVRRQDLAAVSANLMKATTWNVGTSFESIGSVCRRTGDYDFVLQPLVRMAYLDDETPMLTREARLKLRHELLSERGIEHHIQFTLDLCPPIPITDSENHILMSEVARYLTNQLLFAESVKAGRPDAAFDNEKNGFNAWMLDHLSEWLRNDFNEVNSKPYQGYTWIALDNLYSFARNQKVKTKAQMVLDYLSAKTALQSRGLRRHPPYRRQLEHRDDDRLLEADTVMDEYSILTGAYEYLPLQSTDLVYRGNDYVALMTATGRYEIPSAIVDLFIDHEAPMYTRLHHRDLEIYAGSKSFLISAGGRFRSQFGYFTGENNEWGVSTVVIPSRYGLLVSELFRIDGPSDWTLKNNICVAPGFACGEGLYVPPLPAGSRTFAKGPWTFYDVSPSMGFYVATYREPETDLAFMEVREPTTSFSSFVNSVLRANPSVHLAADTVAAYQTSEGHRIRFTPNNGSLGVSQIQGYDSISFETDSSKWALASGSVMRSKGDGLIVITNPRTHQTMTLDDRDPQSPRRTQ